MSKILKPIPPQSFELIRDRLGEILIDEFTSQAVLTTDEDLEINLFVERSFTISTNEMPACNIVLEKGTYDNKDLKQSDGSYTYNIDFYTCAASTDEKEGDSIASVKLQRLLGVCRAILENPHYRTLGYQSPFIIRTSVSDFKIADPEKRDAENVMMGRLVFNVKAIETIELKDVPLLAGYETTVKLGTTQYGYYYTKPQ